MRNPFEPWLFRDGSMRDAFTTIRRDAVKRVHQPQKSRLWTYEALGDLYGSPEAWEYEGPVRSAMYGAEARLRLAGEWGLFWTASGSGARGLHFTADPRTGLRWERARVAEEVLRAAPYLVALSEICEGGMPAFRHEFRDTAGAAERMERAARRLENVSSSTGSQP